VTKCGPRDAQVVLDNSGTWTALCYGRPTICPDTRREFWPHGAFTIGEMRPGRNEKWAWNALDASGWGYNSAGLLVCPDCLDAETEGARRAKLQRARPQETRDTNDDRH